MRSQRAPATEASSAACAYRASSTTPTQSAALQHGELLGQDLLARLAEHALVVESHVREADDARGDHTRRVMAPAEAGLGDAGLDAGLGEHEERGRCQGLELRRPLPALPLDSARRLLHA